MSPPCIIVAGGSHDDYTRWCYGHKIDPRSPLIMHVTQHTASRLSAVALSRSATRVVGLGADPKLLDIIASRRRLP